nr:probable alpha-amylase 2 [Tanacetum cinerariifolium]
MIWRSASFSLSEIQLEHEKDDELVVVVVKVGNRSTGDNFNGVPNIDHTQDFVRKDIIGWLKWLHHKVGFQDFRFDFARGYSAKYVKEYIEGAKPIFSVGEYWDTCNYKGTYLDYNQGISFQTIIIIQC